MSVHRLKPSDYAGRTQHAHNLKHRRQGLRIFLACLVSLCLFVLTAAGMVYHDLSKQVNATENADKLLSRTREPNDDFSGRALNILVLGSDSRSNGNDAVSLTNNNDPTQRADTTMLVHISKDRSRVEVVSLPRDMLVDIPECKRSDGTVSPAHKNTQFNWAFSLGGGDRGDVSAAMACTWKTVENFSGLTIDEAIIVDFDGFITMIDALDGINVYVPHEIKDPRNTGLVTEAGCKHFDGHQALQYARVRHGVEGGDGGDMQRMNRQQEVVGIMMREALRKNIFTSINQLYGFVRAGLNSLTVSVGLQSFSSLSGLAWSLHSLEPKNLYFVNLPVVEDASQKYRLQIYDKQADLLWAALKNDQPIPAGFPVRDGNGTTYVIEDASQAKASESASPSNSLGPSSENSSPENSQSSESPTMSTAAPTVNSTDTVNSQGDDEKERIAQLQAKCEAK